jgi:lipopolysaccharide/colanic/teichoic acid biosynthesis glycosyltransferase
MFGNFRPSDPCPGVGTLARPTPTARATATEQPAVAPDTPYLATKRVVDVVLGTVLLVALAPVIAVTGLLIVLTSWGPVFYSQTRLGQFGRPFVIWKLRTMRHRCEDRSGARWSTRGDTRVTFVGRILRKLHIDEFPQLWNVLRGDMSLVGPRPERPEFFPVLSAAVPGYARRLAVKPGVTGLAQVYLPPDEDVAGVRRKQAFDLDYIRTIGLGLDLRLMVATALQAVGVPHGLVRRLLFLPDRGAVEAAHRYREPMGGS